MKACRAASGFAYIWTLILIAMLGVGLTVAADTYATVAARDREAQLLAVGHEFRRALEGYYSAQAAGANHQYPESLEQLLRDPRFPGMRRYLRRIYVDPMTGKAEWGTVRMAGRIVGIHSLAEGAPLKRANFALEDAGFADAGSYREWIFTYPPQLLLKTQEVDESALPGTPAPMQENAP